MSKYTVIKLRTVMAVCFAVLSMITGLAACGGGGSNPSPVNTNQIYASASPALIASGGTSVITWFSIDKKTTCSASPTAKIGASTGDNTISGSFTTVPLTTTTEFSIRCGEVTRRVIVSVPPAAINAAIRTAAACSLPPLTGGNTFYYCDCGAGANANCVPGVDGLLNDGTDSTRPRKTLEDAMTLFSSMSANDTVALCQGGAFDAKAGSQIGASRCGGPGSACNDLKDYRPTWLTGTAKPIINSASGLAPLFTVTRGNGGIRFLNLSLKGNGTNTGFFFYNGAHDVTVCNTDMDAFAMAVHSDAAELGSPTNITITGNTISNSSNIGFLGSGDNFELSHNSWEGNGAYSGRTHAIYPTLSGSYINPSNMRIIGNYIHGQYGDTCKGTLISGHAFFDSLLIKDNYVSVDAAAVTDSCSSMALNNNTGGRTNIVYYHNTVITGNTLINGGNNSLNISSSTGAIIENNLIIQDWPAPYSVNGIGVASYPNTWYLAASGRTDEINNATVIRNNTIWFGPNSCRAGYINTGVSTAVEGTGYIVSNNTVSSEQTAGTLVCFTHDYFNTATTPPFSIPPLPLSAYAFVDNNHCNSVSPFYFGRVQTGVSPNRFNYYSLVDWQTYISTSGYTFDANSITGAPHFVNSAIYNFKPLSGSSPLVGAGTSAASSGVPPVSYMSTYDITGTTARPSPPAIGAYEP